MNRTKKKPIDTGTFGGRIKYIRRQRHLTQGEFGGRIYVSAKTISRWERGEAIPPADAVSSICCEFGISAGWMLGLDSRTGRFRKKNLTYDRESELK